MFDIFKRNPNRGVEFGAGLPGALSGSFNLQKDVIIGWVNKVPPVPNGLVKVEAWRGAVLVAECEAGPDKGQIVLPFSMPIDGRFTVAELARETVHLTARNARGDSGRLTLDGKAQVELIREHMGVPVEPIFDLDFTQGGNARSWLGEGWSGSETHYTWTLEDDSFIHFHNPRAPGKYLLRMRYGAFISSFISLQLMEIFLNEQFVESFTEASGSMQYREVSFRSDLFGSSDVASFRFNHPMAARSSDHNGGSDTRRVAFCFQRLTLVRRISEQEM